MSSKIGQLNRKQAHNNSRQKGFRKDEVRGKSDGYNYRQTQADIPPVRVLENLDIAKPDDILSVQNQLGNQTVQRMLSISLSDDQLTDQRGELDQNIADRIRKASHKGKPLPEHIKREMSTRIGSELSDVQIHTDDLADQLSRQMNAHAFTIGKHVFFKRGAYAPNTSEGRYTLTHELTHVVQQSGKVDLDAPLKLGAPQDRHEKQAHDIAKKVNTPENASTSISIKTPVSASSATGVIQRETIKQRIARLRQAGLKTSHRDDERRNRGRRTLPPARVRNAPAKAPARTSVNNQRVVHGVNADGDNPMPLNAPQASVNGPQKLNPVNYSGGRNLVGTSQFTKDWRAGVGAVSFGLGTYGGMVKMGSLGVGLAKENVSDEDTQDTLGAVSSGLAIGSGAVSTFAKGLGVVKGVGDLSDALSKKNNTAAGKRIRNEKGIKAGLDITSNVLGMGAGSSLMAKGISNASGNESAAQGAGYAGGAFGIAGGLFGGATSLAETIRSGRSVSKASRFTKSQDRDIQNIAKAHKHQQTAKSVESGLGIVAGGSGIVSGVGGILGAAGLKEAGSIMGLVGTGVGLLSGIGQKFAKGAGTKDVDKASQGLAARIKADNQEAIAYAESLGIKDARALKDDKNLSALIKMKMGG